MSKRDENRDAEALLLRTWQAVNLIGRAKKRSVAIAGGELDAGFREAETALLDVISRLAALRSPDSPHPR
jgi:hypothetical protein